MNLVETAIQEFGHSLGMSDLAPEPTGAVALDFEHRGRLYLEPQDDELLIYLAREHELLERHTLESAWRSCHYREGLPFAAQVGLNGERLLVFSVRLETPEISLPNLERVVELLSRLHDKLAES